MADETGASAQMADGATKGHADLALAVLRQTFGYDAFRPHQAEIIDAALTGRDVLAVMPTSAGKSICYQVPALMLGGITVVVSPLISLMADQVGALRQTGVSAACLNSSLAPSERDAVLTDAATGTLSLLYVAPERLDDPAFLDIANARGLALLAVDEAHCISQWGNDFRPSYQRIGEFVAALPARPPIMALTATATRQVREDIVRALGLHQPFSVTASFDRPNLSFAVERPGSRKAKDRLLVDFARQRADKSGIVYCSSRKAVEEVCDLLCEAGLSATRYHAGLPAWERDQNQQDFLYDRARVMVATNAFGMGIDKSNVSYVAHYNMPLSLENYYQEAGRAGRDGTKAECLLLYSAGDVRTAEFLLSRTERTDLTPEQLTELRRHDEERLRQMVFYCTTTDCLRAFILRYFGEEAPAYCGNCSNCLADFEQVDATEEALKVVSCVARLSQRGQSAGASAIVDILRGSKSERTLSRGYDTLSTYGIMATTPVPTIRALIDELVYRGVLARSSGDYPVITLTTSSGGFLREMSAVLAARKADAGDDVVAGRAADGDAASAAATASADGFLLKVAKGKRRARRESSIGGAFGASGTPKRRVASAAAELDEAGQELYERLAALRTELAQEQGVPAFYIFSNATLADMCAKRPKDAEELLGVSGVGVKKAERYGEAFLARINGSEA